MCGGHISVDLSSDSSEGFVGVVLMSARAGVGVGLNLKF